MGSLSFSACKGQVLSADCHWTPDSYETLYMDIEAAKRLRKELDDAIKRAKKA